VDTDETCAAIKDVYEETRAILEPAGALAIAGAKAWVEKKGVRGQTLVAVACGANTNSSRTWVDFFDQTGKRLYGFCALGKPADLDGIWFALEEGVIPPSWIYIEINDRQTNTKYKSNLADTTL